MCLNYDPLKELTFAFCFSIFDSFDLDILFFVILLLLDELNILMMLTMCYVNVLRRNYIFVCL